MSGARRAQIISTAIAVASPPPMQSAATPFFLPFFLQRAEQRDHDARAARADRVAERDRAAVHVHDLVRQLELAHRRHRHRGERLVDLPEVDLLRRSSRPSSATLSIAPTGAVVNQSGACAWTLWPTMRAIGLTPRRAAVDSRISTSAAAPS